MEQKKIKSFTDLHAWQEAHKLVLMIYEVTSTYPKEERYCLIDQMRRAALSVSSNIAEGFSRQSLLEKKHFYHVALGSLTELQNQLLVSRGLKYILQSKFTEVANQTIVVSRLANALIKYVKTASHT